MRRELLDLIVRPDCVEDLRVVEECTADGEIESGTLECSDERCFVIERFVSSDDYADACALEWNDEPRRDFDERKHQSERYRRRVVIEPVNLADWIVRTANISEQIVAQFEKSGGAAVRRREDRQVA
jgi:hypothetical protein